jgi:hypothetical protein
MGEEEQVKKTLNAQRLTSNAEPSAGGTANIERPIAGKRRDEWIRKNCR